MLFKYFNQAPHQNRKQYIEQWNFCMLDKMQLILAGRQLKGQDCIGSVNTALLIPSTVGVPFTAREMPDGPWPVLCSNSSISPSPNIKQSSPVDQVLLELSPGSPEYCLEGLPNYNEKNNFQIKKHFAGDRVIAEWVACLPCM